MNTKKRSINQKDCRCGCGKKVFASVNGKDYCYVCYDKNVNEERAKDKPVIGR